MASFDEPSFKLKYQKYKLKVKLWESEFTKSTGRIPSKDDIKSASPDIREAYRKYWKLKTLNLQRTILEPMLLEEDCSVLTFDDVKTVNKNNATYSQNHDLSNSDTNMSLTFEPTEDSQASLNFVVESSLCIRTPDPSNEEPDQSIKELNVWGSHLNKQKPKKSELSGIIDVKPSSSSQFSKKLFGGSKFNLKRNPRKLNRFSQRSKSEIDLKPNSVSLQLPHTCHSFQDSVPKKLVSLETSSHEGNIDFLLDHPSEHRAFKITKPNEHHARNSISIVDKAILDSKTLKTRELNDGWVKRNSLIGVSGLEISSLSQPEPIPSLNISENKESTVLHETNVEDDDLVSDSDTESSQKTSFFQTCMKRKKIGDKTLEVEDCDSTREQRPDKIQKMAPMSSESDTSATKESPNIVVSLPKTMLKKLSKATDDSFDLAKQTPKRENGEDSNKQTSSKVKALERKIASGTANENFVKINIKKKVYARGKKNTSFSKYKKMMFKKKGNRGGDSELCGKAVMKCFKCGDVGHYARNCMKADKLLPAEENEEDVSEFPTLEEAANMCKAANGSKHSWDTGGMEQHSEEGGKEGNGEQLFAIEMENSTSKIEVKPVYQLLNGEELIDTPEEVYNTLKMFGHEEFRSGQEEAIMRILSGQSTLLMLSTGAGKSLCYQLPAYIFAQKSTCVTLVVSPLVSLMEDQILGLPSFLKSACLHSNQTTKQREKVLEQIKKGNMHFLLVSPEAVAGCSGGKGSTINFRNFLSHLPPIAFACIDEAHCVSQWSHNFRPSYLMVCKILRETLGVKTILGLTATATRTTASSIASHLEIPDGERGIIKGIPLPNNLILSASQDNSRDQALVALMNGKRFQDCGSLIIYCTRREECERLATFIRTQFRDAEHPESNAKRNRISWNAESYHAGLSAARRKKVQQAFMNGTLRIVIATVAFGMGINKHNIRGIIHYNMPSNIESYVQEVGRAGRDGLTAHCHVFMDKKGGDLNELRRHIFSDSIDRHTIRKLLQKVFVLCDCDRKGRKGISSQEMEVDEGNAGGKELESTDGGGCSVTERVVCPRHEVAIPVDETINALDLPEENIATLLCYLELHPKRWIKVLNRVYTQCKIQCYQGPKQLKEAAHRCPALAMAIAIDLKKGVTHEKSNSIEFSVVEIASRMGWDSGLVKKHLKDLEWKKGAGDRWHRTGILVEFSVLGFHFEAPGNLLPSELDEGLDSLHNRVLSQEEASLKQLSAILSALNSVAHKTCLECNDEVEETRSDKLKEYINKYFREEIEVELMPEGNLSNEQVRDDIRQLVCSFRDQSFTGRAVARILHGISSPCFPAYVWGRNRFWRLHLSSDFRVLCKVATDEILRLR